MARMLGKLSYRMGCNCCGDREHYRARERAELHREIDEALITRARGCPEHYPYPSFSCWGCWQ